MKWEPLPYQVNAAKFLLQRPGAGLFLDPGLRKTSITLAALDARRRQPKGLRALIIAPLRVVQLVWPGELEKWSDTFGALTMDTLHGKDKSRLLKQGAHIQLVNPEGLPWLLAEAARMKKWPWDTLVVDESTKFKNWNGVRAKLLRKHAALFERRWLLTGTPQPRQLEDLFAQVYLMDGGAALGRFITHFRMKYMQRTAHISEHVWNWEPMPGAQDAVAKKIAHLVLRLSEKDYLDIPPLLEDIRWVELPPKARAQYKELERELFLKLEKGVVTAANAGVLTQKLRQAANGIIYTEDGEHETLHSAKLDALLELLEELDGEPLLLAVAFHPEVDAIRTAAKALCGGNIPYIGQGMTGAALKEAETLWNAKKLPLMLAHPSSAAYGLNFQANHHVGWFGMTWNFEEYDQFIRRLRRSGQAKRVVNHRFMARNTIDLAITQANDVKDRNQNALFDSLVSYSRRKR